MKGNIEKISVYHDYAFLYDIIFRSRNTEGEISYLDNVYDNLIEKSSPSIIDMGCGTGEHIEMMTDYGYNCIGIDLSFEMIKLSLLKILDNDSARVLHADDKYFNLDSPADGCFSVFSTFNHKLKRGTALEALRSYAQNLCKGGIFVLDVISPEKYRENMKRREEEPIKGRHYEADISTSLSDSNIADVRENYHVRVNKYHEIEFTNDYKFRIYSKDELIDLLKESGYEIIDVEEQMHKEHDGRIVITSQLI